MCGKDVSTFFHAHLDTIDMCLHGVVTVTGASPLPLTIFHFLWGIYIYCTSQFYQFNVDVDGTINV